MLPIYLIVANTLIFMLFMMYLGEKYNKFPVAHFLLGCFICIYPVFHLKYLVKDHLLKNHLDWYFISGKFDDWVLWILISVFYTAYYQLLRMIWKKEELRKECTNLNEIGNELFKP